MMIRVALTGGIGSGKTFISRLFGYPVFNADKIVSKIYSKDKKLYFKLQNKLPKYFFDFPIKKKELINAIINNKKNIKKITSIVHPIVKKELKLFCERHKKKKLIILDIPLYLENRINKKNDVIIFIQTNYHETLKRVKKRKNFNKIIFKRLNDLQLPLDVKKNKSNYIIKNNYNKISARKKVKDILKEILS